MSEETNSILHAPAAERNRAPILEILRGALPERGTVLEVASGTGQHIVFFAAAMPGLQWIPSDPDPRQRRSIAARTAQAHLNNVAAPMDIDVLAPWPALHVDAVISANLLHVSAAETMKALCQGAAAALRCGGLLHVYGPFNRDGRHTSTGNRKFDQALRQQNSAWGIRDVEDLVDHAAAAGLHLETLQDMPSNNLSVLLRKSQQST